MLKLIALIQTSSHITYNIQSTNFLVTLFTGENLVSKPPLQVQAAGKGEGNGGTESQQSGELSAHTPTRGHVVDS